MVKIPATKVEIYFKGELGQDPLTGIHCPAIRHDILAEHQDLTWLGKGIPVVSPRF
jgi:hypothetical protein